MTDPLRLSDITSMRLSVAATRKLSPDQIERLLDEVEVLLRQRDELAEVMAELRTGPWPALREQLGALHRTLNRSRLSGTSEP